LEDTGQTDEDLSKRYHPEAERRVREYLLLQKVIDQEGLAPTDEMLEQGYNELAEAMNQTVETIKQFHQANKESYEVFSQKTLEKEAVKFIIENGTIEIIEADTAETQKSEAGTPESEPDTKTDENAQGGE